MRLKPALFLLALPFFAACDAGKEETIQLSNSQSVEQPGEQPFYIPIPDTNPDPSWKKENQLYVHFLVEPDNMHPTNSTSATKSELSLYTQICLVRYNFEDGTAFPQLAEALPDISADGLVYTYHLKKQARWDDGSPITAEDVAFTAKANKCPFTENPSFKSNWDNVQSVSIVNPQTVAVHMKQKYMLNDWFWNDFQILQRRFYDPDNILVNYSFEQLDSKELAQGKTNSLTRWAREFNSAKFGQNFQFLNGGGPYKITLWDKGHSIVLQKKKDHWSQQQQDLFSQASPEKIICKFNRDPNSTKLEFKDQVYDVSTYIDLASFEELQADPNFRKNYNARLCNTYNYSYMAINTKPDGQQHKKLFTDKRVRRAIAMLTPLDDINRIINHNNNQRLSGPVSPLKKEYNKDLKLIPLDLEGARKLLAEAGWKDSDGDHVLDQMIDGQKVNMEFRINYLNTHTQWADMARLIAESMNKAGVKAILNPLEYNVLVNDAMTHHFDMMIGAWQCTATPEDFSQIWHSRSWSNGGFNFTGFGTPQSDALIDSINHTLNEAQRHELVKKFQAMVYEEQPYVFLFSQVRRVILHKRWGNQRIYFEQPSVLLNTFQLKTAAAHDHP